MTLTRRGRLLGTLLVVLTLLGVGVLVVTRTTLGGDLVGGPACTLDTASGRLDWSPGQARTATTVAGVGTRIGASTNGVAAAVRRSLAAADQDGALAPEAAREVYRRLPDVARPGAADVAVAVALLGGRGPALSCRAGSVSRLPLQAEGSLGLTPRAAAVRASMEQVFGRQSLGGFQPGGVSSGHGTRSAHYEGRALDVFFRPVTEAGTKRGWQLAMWAVAHADRLDVATVIFDRRIWTAERSAQGWRQYRYPGGTDNPILLHEDHVHVDVQRGTEA